MNQHTLTLLGTSAGCGIPAFFCGCAACEEARLDPRLKRGCCGFVICGKQKTLLDSNPNIREQLEREKIKLVDSLILTHAHSDHIGGLGELEYMIRLKMTHALPLHCSEFTFSQLDQEFHYMIDCFKPHTYEVGDHFEIDGVTYTPLAVSHAPGTFGYFIETEHTKIFYASDTGTLPKQTLDYIEGVDYFIIDSTFWQTNPSPANHHTVHQAIETGLAIKAEKIILTHLGLHLEPSITISDIQKSIDCYHGQVIIAYDGMQFSI